MSQADKHAFATNVVSRVVAKLSRDAGFESIQQIALEALTDIAEQHLEKLLSLTHEYAQLAHRIKPNYYDILRSFDDNKVGLQSLGIYLNKIQTEGVGEPIRLEHESEPPEEEPEEFLPSDEEEEEEDFTARSYVPSHMPKFPSKHSFQRTPVYIQRPDDPQKVRELNSQQSRIVEENLKRFMSAENNLIRKHRLPEDALPEADEVLRVPIVNYETSMQRRKRAKAAVRRPPQEKSPPQPATL